MSCLKFLLGCLIVNISLLGSAWADNERITSYTSDIRIDQDGILTITETIIVNVLGRQIKHGIYRDFPTTYRTSHGELMHVGFHLLEVTRDGVKEPHHTSRLSNGRRIYIGSQDQKVSPGVHTYKLTFRTDRQIGFFPDHDELYFNAIGTGWSYPISDGRAFVTLPQTVPPNSVKLYGYTGLQGSKAGKLRGSILGGNLFSFELTRPLGPFEGMTIVAEWPKGIIREPTQLQLINFYISDHLITIILSLSTAAWFLYAFSVWFSIGRDPKGGVIVPLFRPPTGLSPAAGRFVYKMGFDHKTFATALISLASKGIVRIRSEGPREYEVELAHDSQRENSPTEEIATLLGLFPHDRTIELTKDNHSEIRQAISACKKALKREYEGIYFQSNCQYVLPGLIIPLLIATPFVLLYDCPWDDEGLYLLANFSLAGLYLLTLYLFHRLIRAPSLQGRKLMDQIEGFRMYLGTAEVERLKLLHPPEQTPEVFERYLPFAFALDVDQPWCEAFSRYLLSQGRDPSDYEPTWYRGSSHFSDFSKTFSSSFSSAISSSSTPPGSSSGSSGSSGGGGGGGGGGGW